MIKHGINLTFADDPVAYAAGMLTPSRYGSTSTDYNTAPTHVFDGGTHGSLAMRNTSAVDGLSWLPSGVGVLACAGAGQAPTFRALVAGDVPQLAYSSLSGLPTLGSSAALDVGTSAGTVAAGNHLHTGVYEPAFATLGVAKGGTGLASFTVGDILYASGSTTIAKLAVGAAGTVLVGGSTPAWSATPTLTSVGFSGGSVFEGSTVNVIEQRNGTGGQIFRLYKTFTNGSNYERLDISTVGGFSIFANKAGTGANQTFSIGTDSSNSALIFRAAGSDRWQISSSGHFLAASDNTYDVGATNATRPRHAHLAGYLAIGDGITAPGAGTGEARIYVDTADGDLKVVFADGTVKTISVDT